MIILIRCPSLPSPFCSFLLKGQGIFEGNIFLMPPSQIMAILRVSSVNRIAQQRNDLRLWQYSHRLFCTMGVKEIFRATLPGNKIFLQDIFSIVFLQRSWKECLVPGYPFVKVPIEVMYLLPSRRL